MSSYTNIFTGGILQPSQKFFEIITLSSNIVLAWSTDFGPNPLVVAAIMNIIPTASGYTVTLPNAMNVSPGQMFSINNKTAFTFTLLLNDGTTPLTVINGPSFNTFYLENNTTANGLWDLIPFSGSSAVTSVGINAGGTDGNLIITNSPITVSGNINIALGDDLLGLATLGDEIGIAVRTSITGLWSTTFLVGTPNQISITNANGVASNPTISLASAISGINSISLGNGNIDIGVAPNVISSNNANGSLYLLSQGSGSITLSAGSTGGINLNPSSTGPIRAYTPLFMEGVAITFLNTALTNGISLLAGNSAAAYSIVLPSTQGLSSEVLGILSVTGTQLNLGWVSAGGGGTVTSVTAGTNLLATPSNPITTTGTISLDPVVAGLTSVAVGNLLLNGNTISSTTGIFLEPAGANAVSLVNNTNAVPLRWYNAAGTHYSALQAGSPTVDTTWVLPLTDGTSGQSLATTGVSGTPLYWTTASGSSIVTTVLGPEEVNYAALTTDNVIVVNTTIYSAEITLPAPSPTGQPIVGQAYEIIDGKGTSVLNSIYLYGNRMQVNNQDSTQTVVTGAGFPLATGNSPGTGIVTPNGNWAYICNEGAASLTVVQNASSTTPTVVTTTLAADANPSAIVVTPNGNYVYAANVSSNTVTVVANASSSGFSSTNLTVGTNPQNVAITPDGQYAYVVNNGSVNVSYIINAQGPTTPSVGGTITDVSFVNPVFSAVSPDGQYVYVVNDESVSVVTVIGNASGPSTPAVITTVTTGQGSSFIAFSPNGQYAYVINVADGTVSVIQDADTDTPSVLTTITVQTQPSWLAFTPDGNFAYVTNYGTGTVTVIQNASTKAPSVLKTLTVGSGPSQILISSNGQYAYVANNLSNFVNIIKDVSSYNPTVVLPNLSGFSNPSAVCITPNNTNIFASNSTTSTLTVIRNNYYGSGNIDFPNTVFAGQNAEWVAFTPDGNRAFVTTQLNSLVAVFTEAYSSSPTTLTTTLGTLSADTTQIVITPNGEYAYSISNSTNALTQYSNVANGFPRSTVGPTVGPFSNWISVTPDGDNLYVVYGFSPAGSVYVFSGASTGSLVAVTGSPFTVGNGPNFVAITPNAKYAYVINGSGNTVSYFSAANTSAPALSLTPLIVGASPVQMAITPNGKYGYVTIGGTNTVAFITNASGPTPTVSSNITITGATDVEQIAITSDGNTVLVTDQGNNLVGFITGASSGTPVFSQTIAVGVTPNAIAITPDSNVAVVINLSDNTASIILGVSSATPYVATTIPVGLSAGNVFIHPSGNYAWVPDNGGFSATIINTSSNFVLSNGKFSYENVIYDGERWVAS